MKLKLSLLSICFAALLLITCKKKNAENESRISTIKLEKNGVAWSDTLAVGTHNTGDGMISILGSDGLETFTIQFKKPGASTTIDQFTAGSLIAPFKASAAIADRYQLDTSKPNKVQILGIDHAKKRIVGDFYLYLKRSPEFGEGEGIYKGRFDVIYQDFTL